MKCEIEYATDPWGEHDEFCRDIKTIEDLKQLSREVDYDLLLSFPKDSDICKIDICDYCLD